MRGSETKVGANIVLLSIVARVACATVLLAAGVSAAVARGPLDEIMDTSFVAVAVMGGHHAAHLVVDPPGPGER